MIFSKLHELGYLIGQFTGVISGVGVCLLWNYAMWGPTSVLSLSETSSTGAFIMSILAIVAVIASIRGHGAVILLMFFVSFFPIGFFFLTEAHWLKWTGVLNLGYLVASLFIMQSNKVALTEETQNDKKPIQ